MTLDRSSLTAGFLKRELQAGVSVEKLLILVAALVSLLIDQSFGGMYGAFQNDVAGALGASADEQPWFSIGYNTFYYVTILLSPWLIGRFGRRQVFGVGHFGFAVLTLYLATSSSMAGFFIGRCFQGLAQGTFFVSSVLTVLTLFPPKLRGTVFSVFAVTSLSGAASGAFVGGWFRDNADWRDAFVTYAVFAIFAFSIIWTLLEAPPGKKTMPFDLIGVVFAFAAFFFFQYASSFGERRDWLAAPDIVLSIFLTAIGFAGFIWRELYEDRCGFIQLSLFNIRNLSVASVLGFGLGVPLLGANNFLQYAQASLGFPPALAGALLAMRIPAILIVAPTVVLLVNADKIDVKVPVALGFIFVPMSYAMLAIQTTSESSFGTFAFALVLSGIGFACLFSPIANVMIRSLPDDVKSEGIAIFKLVLLLGGSVATTGLGAVYDRSFAGLDSLLAGEASLRHFIQVGLSHPSSQVLALVAQQATVLAYSQNSMVVAISSLVNLPLVVLLRKPGAVALGKPSLQSPSPVKRP